MRGGRVNLEDGGPSFAVHLTSAGPDRCRVFQLIRQTLGLRAADARPLLDAARVELARGPRSAVEAVAARFASAGATVVITPAP